MEASDESRGSAGAPPRADLARLSITRGAEGAAQPRGFPWMRALLLVGALALLFLFRAPLLGLLPGAGGVTVRTARAVKVVPGQAAQGDVSANGYVVADKQASLASVISGRLVELNAAEGDIVEANSVVARIQFDDLEAGVRQAHANLQAAQARTGQARFATQAAAARVTEVQRSVAASELSLERLAEERQSSAQAVAQAVENADRLEREVERNRSLYEKRRIDAGTWDRIQTEARTARLGVAGAQAGERAAAAAFAAWQGEIRRRQATLAVAEAEQTAAGNAEVVAQAAEAAAAEDEHLAAILLEKTRIRAPFRGLVIRKDAEKGEVIAPTGAGNSRGSVLTIVDPESLEVQVELSERRIARVQEGDRAHVFLDADPERGLPGVVRKIWPRADRSKGSIEIRVRLAERPAALRPEMAARVVFKGSKAPETGEAYVSVPAAAVATRGSRKVVFVLLGARVRLREVEVGEASGDRVRVHRGLEGGEAVVLHPPGDLEDGAAAREESE